MKQITVGIVGYGNLGKGVEKSIRQNPDIRLEAIFTRREPNGVEASVLRLYIFRKRKNISAKST